MSAHILDGKALAASIKKDLAARTQVLKANNLNTLALVDTGLG